MVFYRNVTDVEIGKFNIGQGYSKIGRIFFGVTVKSNLISKGISDKNKSLVCNYIFNFVCQPEKWHCINNLFVADF